MDNNSDGFQCLLECTAYWRVHAIDYWQGANVKCGRHGMARSVMEAQSHDEDTVGWKKCNRSSRECIVSQECMVSQFAVMHSVFPGIGMFLQTK